MALIIRQLDDVTGHGNGSAMRSAPGIIFQKLQMQI
jgi:ADP-ribosylglycohydrolase